MSNHISLLDTVALSEDVPQRDLKRGEVGTVVEILAPDTYEVEFCDDEGQTFAMFALRADRLMVLHNQGEAFENLGLNLPTRTDRRERTSHGRQSGADDTRA